MAKKVIEDSQPFFYSILNVEVMYYHAARKCLKESKAGWPAVEKELSDLKKLDDKWEALVAKNVDGEDRRFEQIAIATESQHFRVGAAYAPVLQALASVHLLCAQLSGGYNQPHRKFKASWCGS